MQSLTALRDSCSNRIMTRNSRNTLVGLCFQARFFPEVDAEDLFDFMDSNLPDSADYQKDLGLHLSKLGNCAFTLNSDSLDSYQDLNFGKYRLIVSGLGFFFQDTSLLKPNGTGSYRFGSQIPSNCYTLSIPTQGKRLSKDLFSNFPIGGGFNTTENLRTLFPQISEALYEDDSKISYVGNSEIFRVRPIRR